MVGGVSSRMLPRCRTLLPCLQSFLPKSSFLLTIISVVWREFCNPFFFPGSFLLMFGSRRVATFFLAGGSFSKKGIVPFFWEGTFFLTPF